MRDQPLSEDFLLLFDADKEQKVISEKEFGKLLEPIAGQFLLIAHYLHEAENPRETELLHMGFIANVIKESSDVEHFLDVYSARNNLNWILFREAAATIKNFSKTAFLLGELKKTAGLHRHVPRPIEDFNEKAGWAAGLFADAIAGGFEIVLQEQKRLKLKLPSTALPPLPRFKVPGEIILPHTIEDPESTDVSHSVKKIAHRFQEVVKKVEWITQIVDLDVDGLSNFIPSKISERSIRSIGANLHNLLSWYDTYVFGNRFESEYPVLKVFRTILSAQVNLFKIATILSHYYERHLFIMTPASAQLEKIISSRDILRITFHVILSSSLKLFEAGGNIATSLLDELVEIVTYELPVPKDLGFHARPSTRVAKVVKHYGADVKMLVDDQVFDASSVLWLLSAGGYILTKGLDKVRFQGDKRALDDLKLLARYNYGETKDGKDSPLPEALVYLN
ncbi:MAG: HPr family phosphocarrier protein [Desulfatiglandaceae bacterium]